MPTVPPSRVPRRRTRAAAAALAVTFLLGPWLSACEYEYADDYWDDDSPTAVGPPTTGAALPQDPHLNEPVTGEELDSWVDDVLPGAAGQVFQAGAAHTETTTPLPAGTYALTLACRSMGRVSFTVRNGEESLVDLRLRCGTSRVNVVQLSADAVLSVEVAARAAANYAYRVSRL
jgi:hypothetical protein